MEGGNIKPIQYSSIHKICSGQVVLTLATAVKELVENSIDAGATIIEVKLKEYGSELIEVIDNGKGVKSSDFQSITLKHHTSKISDFSDVSFVSTFGFRGEALSSLCALSNVEIITCHSDAPVGSLLVYDHDGTLVKKSCTHRQVGTTVIVKNVFSTLPVRHKEFHRNLRREYARMLQVLTAYCLISVKKRITCTNVTDKGRKTIAVATNSCDSFKDNIACIFGSKQVDNLMEFVQISPSETVLEEYFLRPTDLDKCNAFRIQGFISNSTHGEGRSSTDRQFFFINGRPCDLPKISKLINEVYHSFNKSQYPFVFLNINLTEGTADVNVTPDKRQIFIPDEKLLLSIIKTSLYHMYQLQPSEMKMSSASLFFCKSTTDSGFNVQQPSSNIKKLEEFALKRKLDTSSSLEQSNFSPSPKNSRKDDSSTNSTKKIANEEQTLSQLEDIQDSPDSGCISSEGMLTPTVIVPTLELECANSSETTKQQTAPSNNINFTLTLPFDEDKAFKNTPHGKTGHLKLKSTLQQAYRGKNASFNQNLTKGKSSSQQNILPSDKIQNYFFKNSFKKVVKCETDEDPLAEPLSVTDCVSIKNNLPDENLQDATEETQIHIDELRLRKKKVKTIAFSIEAIKRDLKTKKHCNAEGGCNYRKFRSKIAPGDNGSAEDELKKEIKKENFSQMDIIGQFNLGFIIARLNNDLFIIDQHATDEKYNFETLQKDTVLETQKLLNPQKLNLTAVSEAILIDNLHIFEKSGFKFSIDEENSVGSKAHLISVPVSHNWRFGKEDVDEMIFMLTDNPVSMIRPSRVNQMFASRACRKSVMIGTALTLPIMRKLVVHMGEIEQPWNCPHGRPTMRHLFNLNLLNKI